MKIKTALVATAILTAAVPPAKASIFEIYVRAHGGYEYLDLTAIDFSGLVTPDNWDPATLPAGTDPEALLDEISQEYSGNGWAVGGQAGLLLIDFLDVGIDFRQAGLTFDKTDGGLTQVALYVGTHFLGTEMIIDPSVGVGFGYCYLTTQIPELSGGAVGGPTKEQTANGFIGRAGAALDFRFIDWMSAGVAVDFSFLYFDGGSDRQAWGINTDVLGRLSIHI